MANGVPRRVSYEPFGQMNADETKTMLSAKLKDLLAKGTKEKLDDLVTTYDRDEDATQKLSDELAL